MNNDKMEYLDFKEWIQLVIMMTVPFTAALAEIVYLHVNVLRLKDRVVELEVNQSLRK